MRRSSVPGFAFLVLIACLLGEGPALAGGAPCSPMAIAVDARLRDRWPDLPARLHEALDSRPDIDTCAKIGLTMRDRSIVVDVALADGRLASRSTSHREDLLPMLEGLLIVPRHEEPAPTSAPEPPPPEPMLKATARGPATVSNGDSLRGLPADTPGHFRAEISVAAGARAGDGQRGVGLGAFSFVEFAPWLMGFEGRIDRYQAIQEPVIAFELGVLVGRRFRFQAVALDLLAGPALALQGSSVIAHSPAGPVVERTSSWTVSRALLGTRLHFIPGSVLRPFIGVDGALSLTAVDAPAGNPELPAWTVGLALGATVGTP